MLSVRFMSLDGEFRTVKTEEFETVNAAEVAIMAHLQPSGYSNLKRIDGEDDGIRWTAKTTGGRNGRNVAYADVGFAGDSDF